jgi:hypothetical protein
MNFRSTSSLNPAASIAARFAAFVPPSNIRLRSAEGAASLTFAGDPDPIINRISKRIAPAADDFPIPVISHCFPVLLHSEFHLVSLAPVYLPEQGRQQRSRSPRAQKGSTMLLSPGHRLEILSLGDPVSWRSRLLEILSPGHRLEIPDPAVLKLRDGTGSSRCRSNSERCQRGCAMPLLQPPAPYRARPQQPTWMNGTRCSDHGTCCHRA